MNTDSVHGTNFGREVRKDNDDVFVRRTSAVIPGRESSEQQHYI